MSLTVINRPLGHVLDTTENDASIWDDYGSAIVVAPGHGLSTGDYVYIKSPVSDYNGFWYVVYNNGSSFYIREYPTASNKAAYVDCDATYQKSVLEHGFQCVHLPIVYKIKSDIWPTNTTGTSRNISSITDDNGLCNLNLSGSLGTFNELEYVKISNNSDFSDEVYQVVNKVSSSDITINRAYEAGLSTGGTVILYFNNYTVYVRIYGGLKSSHFWQAQKPYELLTTLKVTPDSNNIATINIAEILKSKIRPTENSTLALTLPNNLDFFTQFYISVAETYDDASTGQVEELDPTFNSDQTSFEGDAVNAMLPFKNIHSGHLSSYIFADSNNLIKFLNLFNPVFFAGEYFDISFINNIATVSGYTFRVMREVYIDDVLKEVFYDNIGNRSEGVYRKVIEQSGWSEDRIDVTIQSSNIIPFEFFDTSLWTNINTGDEPWSITESLLSVQQGGINTDSDRVSFAFDFENLTETFSVDYTFNEGLAGSGQAIMIVSSTASGAIVTSQVFASSDSTGTATISLTVSSTGSYFISFIIKSISSFVLEDHELDITSVTCLTRLQNVSETKTIEVNSECASNEIYLGWLNYLGGFEYWKFTARKDYVYEVEKSQITQKNIYTNWPQSYGEFANSITKQVARNSRKKIVVRSQHLTQEQLEGIKFIRFSPLVQIVIDKYNVTNVVVDSGSFTTFRDAQDMFTLEFSISFTDQIPAQFE